MSRILVVANHTLGGRELANLLRERSQAGGCHIHVVVPAGPDPRGWSHNDTEDRAGAQRRLAAALDAFATLGCPVTGEVGDARPVDAVLDALRREPADEVVLSTLPPGVSRWLRTDLVRRVERAVDVPVTHVIGAAEPSSAR
jgi:hypothetical protein